MRSATVQIARGKLFLIATFIAVAIDSSNDPVNISMAPEAHRVGKLSCTANGEILAFESKVAKAELNSRVPLSIYRMVRNGSLDRG